MKLKYPILITQIENNAKKISIPDLGTQIFVSEEILESTGLINYIKNKITSHVVETHNKGQKINFPKTLDDYKNIVLEKDEFWIEVEVEVDITIKKGVFERSFPIIGLSSRFVTMVLYAVMAMFATQLSVGDDDKVRGRTIGITGAFCALFMAMIIFIFSNAMKTVAAIGKKVDDVIFRFFCGSTAKDATSISATYIHDSRFGNPFYKNSSAKILRTLSILTLGGLSLIDSTSFGNTSAQSLNTIIYAVNKNEYNSQIPDTVILTLTIIMGIAAGLSSFAFDIGFSMSAVDSISKWLNNRSLKKENTTLIVSKNFFDASPTNLESGTVIEQQSSKHSLLEAI